MFNVACCSEKFHYREESSSIYISCYSGCSSCSIITRNQIKHIYICAVGSLSDVRGESRGYVEIFEECRAYAPALSETRYKMRGCEKPDRTTHATRCDELKKNLPSRFIHLSEREHSIYGIDDHGDVSTRRDGHVKDYYNGISRIPRRTYRSYCPTFSKNRFKGCRPVNRLRSVLKRPVS